MSRPEWQVTERLAAIDNELAELSGKDLWQVAAASPLVRSFEALACRIANVEGARERDQPFISRLISAFSAHA